MSAENGVVKTSLLDFMSARDGGVADAVVQAAVAVDEDDEAVEQPAAAPATPAEPAAEDPSSYFYGEGETKLHQEAKFKVGEAFIPAKDIFNSYVTREEISRRFNEVGKREQRTKADMEYIKTQRKELKFINDKFEEMADLVRQGNTLGALQVALSMSDNADKDTLEGLVKKSIEIAENFHNMSTEEQKVFLEKEGVALRERKVARKEKADKDAEALAQVTQYYDGVLAQYSIIEDEMDQAFTKIQADEKRKAVLEDPDPYKRINACVAEVVGQRFTHVMDEGIRLAAPEMVTDSKLRLALIDLLDPRYTADDVADVVAAYAGKDHRKNSAKAAVASTKDVATATTPHRAPTKPAEKKESEPASTYAGDFEALIRKYS